MLINKMETILQGRDGRSEQLIKVLQDMQAEFKYLPEDGLRLVADRLFVPPIEVYRVESFYKAFSLTPRSRHVLTVPPYVRYLHSFFRPHAKEESHPVEVPY